MCSGSIGVYEGDIVAGSAQAVRMDEKKLLTTLNSMHQRQMVTPLMPMDKQLMGISHGLGGASPSDKPR